MLFKGCRGSLRFKQKAWPCSSCHDDDDHLQNYACPILSSYLAEESLSIAGPSREVLSATYGLRHTPAIRKAREAPATAPLRRGSVASASCSVNDFSSSKQFRVFLSPLHLFTAIGNLFLLGTSLLCHGCFALRGLTINIASKPGWFLGKPACCKLLTLSSHCLVMEGVHVPAPQLGLLLVLRPAPDTASEKAR